jgi:formylglycine-generating enzyme required for sulfatase activity
MDLIVSVYNLNMESTYSWGSRRGASYNRGNAVIIRISKRALFLILYLFAAPAAWAAEPDTDYQPEIAANSVGMRLARVPAGAFLMGGQESAEAVATVFADYRRPAEFFKDEYPRHRVCITKPFRLGVCEVTVGQFRRFVEATGYQTEAEADGLGGWGYNVATGRVEGRDPEYTWRKPGFAQKDDHPVVNVSWNDAMRFCKWLSRKEGKTYRLPTEAEWEYACRGGTTTRYHYGDDPAALVRQARVFDAQGKDFAHVHKLVLGPGTKFTAAGGSFPANRFGLHDMHGNVWEWCADWYAEDYYACSPVDDPKGPDTGTVRVRRGGGWNTFPPWARASFRNWNSPVSRCANLGFRIACDD